LEEAFENAALAMFEVMTDTSTVESTTTDSFQVDAHDEYALLYRWLETLLVKFEIDMKLYSRFKVAPIKKRGESLSFSATAQGETYLPEKHPARGEVKAVTYHRMEIETKPGSVSVRYILDL
jgi:SHS2 domain-containing protein